VLNRNTYIKASDLINHLLYIVVYLWLWHALIWLLKITERLQLAGVSVGPVETSQSSSWTAKQRAPTARSSAREGKCLTMFEYPRMTVGVSEHIMDLVWNRYHVLNVITVLKSHWRNYLKIYHIASDNGLGLGLYAVYGTAHGAETWTLLKEDSRRLQAFHMTCQRRILGIRWNDFITNRGCSWQHESPEYTQHHSRSPSLHLWPHTTSAWQYTSTQGPEARHEFQIRRRTSWRLESSGW